MMDEKADSEAPTDTGADKGGLGSLAGSRWEWITAAISFVLVGAAIVFLLRDTGGAPTPPPAIEITVDSVVGAAGRYLVEFHAYNSSATAAAAVLIEGSLRSGADSEPERSQVTLDHLPGRSTRAAGLYFTRDPREGDLEIRPLGYSSP